MSVDTTGMLKKKAKTKSWFLSCGSLIVGPMSNRDLAVLKASLFTSWLWTSGGPQGGTALWRWAGTWQSIWISKWKRHGKKKSQSLQHTVGLQVNHGTDTCQKHKQACIVVKVKCTQKSGLWCLYPNGHSSRVLKNMKWRDDACGCWLLSAYYVLSICRCILTITTHPHWGNYYPIFEMTLLRYNW